ncbi:MAG: hypothetical protein E1N59_369 [Puniceicoccaceae bacterium 5H]|nr:MAG: hypothetical protein E1N59_369 [Puniceicoccaceae bacterium 5H]
MADTTTRFTEWLKNAYGMEKAFIEMLERQSSRLENYPFFAEKVTDHLEASKKSADRIGQLLQDMGEKPDSAFSGVSSLAAKFSSLFNTTSDHEAVQYALSNFGYVNFAIASYVSLLASADQLNHEKAKPVIEQNLSDKREFADFLADNIPAVTLRFLERESVAAKAKR